MYLGLLNFSILIVFGLTGLVVTFGAPDIFNQNEGPAITLLDFTAPPSASDNEVGQIISATVPDLKNRSYYGHRDEDNQFVADFYGPNGLVRATVLESAHRLEVRNYRNSIWRFIDNIHATTFHAGRWGTALRVWGIYVEFSIWSLMTMVLSGICLAVSVRWRYRWTLFSIAAGWFAFTVFWIVEK
jgi:hypothetical protein